MKTWENQVAMVGGPLQDPPGDISVPPGHDDNSLDKKDSVSVLGANESKSDISYSLRSQLKRPINSECDHDQEPLTKKPAKDWKKSSAKLGQEFQSHDERFTSEIALNIDLIIKSLFRFMNCSTLKSCRLVSKRWKYFGAKELQRRPNVTTQLSFGYVIDKSEKSVQSLLSVMQKADDNTFPCASFNILTEELSSPRIKNFFRVAEAQRNQIKQLSLVLNYEKKKLPIEESTLLEDLRDMLHGHLPNLEALKIKFCLPSHWADGMNTWDSGLFQLKNSPCLLRKLTSLNLSGPLIPKKLFCDVMDAAVNLMSYAGFEFSPERLEYFIDGNGRSRIHLLKHLNLLLCESFLEVMERLLIQHGDNLKLVSFYCFHFCTRLGGGVNFWSRTSVIVSQLLSSSASTLRELGISVMGFFPGLEVPGLPNLHNLLLVENFTEGPAANNYFFPRGFSLMKSFPNLVVIDFAWGSILNSLEMLSITEPILSVKYIYVGGSSVISVYLRGRLKASFPFLELIDKCNHCITYVGPHA